ncbi:hypothetical protein C4B68_11655 [Streptomyces dengpaensis]|uniref:Uncharacterized protein n=1 Tax=Streptomyces dengpaensis TaxID=2049881 RepID=A0ABM6SPA0_9ACTN|nr:hypothetical protein C4B68_11655 [Streptomyces dengpaensis]PIB05661.1 hypothetical protein B1C81_27825 [Streptomyces sp. HG99]
MRLPARLLPAAALAAGSALLTGCFSATGSDASSAEGKRIRVAMMQDRAVPRAPSVPGGFAPRPPKRLRGSPRPWTAT